MRFFLPTVIISILVSIALFTSTCFATEYQYTRIWNHPPNCAATNGTQSPGAGFIRRLHFNFETISQQFIFELTTEPCEGIQPDGYYLVMSPGPNPKGHAGELAIMYFDASDPADHKLTVYAYNGISSSNSYFDGQNLPGDQEPDRILSSLIDPTFLLESSMTDDNSGPVPLRKIRVVIDAKDINMHTPAYPDVNDPWTGASFFEKIGIWFHHTAGTSTAYCQANDNNPRCLNQASHPSEGFLKSFQFSIQGGYDGQNHSTIANELPTCRVRTSHGQAGQDKCIDVRVGDTFNGLIRAVDGDDKLLTVNYSGVPANAIVTPASGSQNEPPVIVRMEWTPDQSQVDQDFEMAFSFTDSKNAEAICNLNICVEANQPPICNIRALDSNPNSCSGAETILKFDGTGSSDPDSIDLTYTWTSTCLDAQGNPEEIIIGADPRLADLLLTLPGTGVASDCEISLSVADETTETKCVIPVSIPACDLDCLNQPNGQAQLDDCGVCNGNNACVGCDGIPDSGLILDECNVCGGNNACRDCAGNINGNAVIDSCNVCNGDNKSCLVCDSSDLSPIQGLMDNSARQAARLISQTMKPIRRIASSKKFVDKTQSTANQLQIQNWTVTWSIPSMILQCEDNPTCVTVTSNAAMIAEYEENARQLLQLNKVAAKRVRRDRIAKDVSRGITDSAVKWQRYQRQRIRLANAEYNKSLTFAAEIPLEFSSCQ